MITRGRAELRAVRALVFGITVLVLATGAHVLAGGPLPSLPLMIAIGVPLACASAVLARRTRGLPALLASLAAAQFVLHEVFVTTARTVASCGPAPAAGHGSHHAVVADCATGAAAVAHHHVATSLPMLLLHALATIATALLLTYGERVVVRLATWARELFVLVPVSPLPVLVQVARFVRAELPLTPLRAATDVSRRGPPVRSALVPVTA